MNGAARILSVVLLEIAAGSWLMLWLGGVSAAVRRSFLWLTAGCALALVLSASALNARVPASSGAALAEGAMSAFALLLGLWLLVIALRRQARARLLGWLGAAAGVLAVLSLGWALDAASGAAQLAIGTILLGGAWYGLLLGHWYLVDRGLSAHYLERAARTFSAGVALSGLVYAVTWNAGSGRAPDGLNPLLALPQFGVLLTGGLLALCALLAALVWRLAREGGRSIQAATGFFYLAVIMAVSAELALKVRSL